MTSTGERAAKASGIVLLTLASGQLLMMLDSSVVNISIAMVAKDVGTTYKRPSTEPCVPGDTVDAIVDANTTARLEALPSSLSLIAVIALIALFFSLRIPTPQPAAAPGSLA